jgi:hypothetical protein
MKFTKDILNELQLLSPLLFEVPKRNVFIVPNGYFETLSATILLCVRENPGVNDDIKILDVPVGYFENLSSNILNKIKEQQLDVQTPASTFLEGIKHSNLFEVPNGYFESLSSVILDKINEQNVISATDELKLLSPLLQSIKHINIFEVPEGYFDPSPADVFHHVGTMPAKVVSMIKSNSNRRKKLIVRYAAAAVVTGAMALGVYKYAEKPVATNTIPAVSFITLDPSIEKGKVMNEQQFNEALNSLTKEDITNYLEKNGSDDDMFLLSSSVEDNLPKKEDYLLDDKTLENYLDKIKFQN